MAADKSAPDLVRSLYLLWGQHPKPGRNGIDVTSIVDAGVQIADAEGLEAASMRRVAERLGVSTMSLYNHVPGKSDLTALMVDRVYGELYDDVDAPRHAGDWRAGMMFVAERNWAMCRRHPWLLDVGETRNLLGPHATRKFEAELRPLDGIGLTDLQMEATLTALLNLVEGGARALRVDVGAQRSSGLDDPAWWAIVAPALEHLMADTDYPVAGRVGSTVGAEFAAARNPEFAYRLGVGLLLDGVAALLDG